MADLSTQMGTIIQTVQNNLNKTLVDVMQNTTMVRVLLFLRRNCSKLSLVSRLCQPGQFLRLGANTPRPNKLSPLRLQYLHHIASPKRQQCLRRHRPQQQPSIPLLQWHHHKLRLRFFQLPRLQRAKRLRRMVVQRTLQLRLRPRRLQPHESQLRRHPNIALRQLHNGPTPLRRRLRLQRERELRPARQRNSQLRRREHGMPVAAADPNLGHELRQPSPSHEQRMRVPRGAEAEYIFWRLQFPFFIQRYGRADLLRAVQLSGTAGDVE